MIVHPAARMEDLAEELASLLRVPSHQDPLARETLIVPTAGLARWLGMRLAEDLGIWAGADVVFPRRWLQRCFGEVLGTGGAELDRAYDLDRLAWTLCAAIPRVLTHEEMAPLARYLDGGKRADPREVRRVQLARRIARVFDGYAGYRPAMVLGWDEGEDLDAEGEPLEASQRWQPLLWRAVTERLEHLDAGRPVHLAARQARFLEALDRAPELAERLPPRVFLFGIDGLPPALLQAYAAIGRRREVHVFALAPTSPLWTALAEAGPATCARWLLDEPETVERALDEVMRPPLLASLGRGALGAALALGAASDAALPARRAAPEEREDAAGASRLARLQAWLRSGRRPPAASSPTSDDSLQVHACHGPMREVEAARDRILGWLDDPALDIAPRDVLVMAPEIEDYAPYIEAAFGVSAADPTYLPFRIADRRPQDSQALVASLGRVLEVLRGRFTLSAVLELLHLESLRRRFGIPAEAVEVLVEAADEAGVRWAIDARHRAGVGQPAREENTWRFGLDRLLLGYALPPAAERRFGGASPAAGVEGGRAELVGRLAELCETLFAQREAMQGRQPLAEWRERLVALMEACLAPARGDSWQLGAVRHALDGLVERAEAAGFHEPIDLEIARTSLLEALAENEPPRGYLSGGVTFCALRPLRDVPHRCVLILGLADGAFPRADRPSAFDLAAAPPRPGDLLPRDADRALFLDALLAARSRLAITYTAFAESDGRPLPPAVLVTELLDAVQELEGGSPGEALPAGLVVTHPLQPFSPRYFGQETADARPDAPGTPHLYSFASRYLPPPSRGTTRPRPFLRGPLPDPPRETDADGPWRLSQTSLLRALQRPSQVLVQDRLGIRPAREAGELDDREPLGLGGLEAWTAGTLALELRLAGLADGPIYEELRAAGALPLGSVGRVDVAPLLARTRALAAAAAPWRQGPTPAPLPFTLLLDDVVLEGQITNLWPRAQLLLRYSQSAGAELEAWLRHLVLCAVVAEGGASATSAAAPRTILIRRDGEGVKEISFPFVPHAADELRALIGLVRRAGREAIPLYPKASRAYAESLGKAPDKEDLARRRARAAFRGSDFSPGDLHEPSVALLFADEEEPDPFAGGRAADFAACAEQVYGTLRDARRPLEPDA